MIVIGDNPLGPVEQEFEVGSNGEFEIPPMAEGEVRVTVVVPDFAPQSRIVEVNNTLEELTFELEPGHVTKILVVDDNGRSIPERSCYDFRLAKYKFVIQYATSLSSWSGNPRGR